MAVFRCKRSGNCIRVFGEADIESLRREESYEEVNDEQVQEARETKETSEAQQGQAIPDQVVLKNDPPPPGFYLDESKVTATEMPRRNNGKIDKRSLQYRQSIGRS